MIISFIPASIMNTDTQIGTKLKFNYEKGEGYMFEAFTTKKVETKKKLSKASFSPRIYVRTPAEELVELSGTVDYMEGKAIRADLTLDKLTKKPFTATGSHCCFRHVQCSFPKFRNIHKKKTKNNNNNKFTIH